MENFTPSTSALGGALIGLSATMMLFFHGRVAGISGIAAGAMDTRIPPSERAWRRYFLLGLVLGGAALTFLMPEMFVIELPRSTFAVAAAGVLVGVGTRLGSGCTSGHGVCGISRLSPRSLVATGTFMLTGALTAFIVRAFFGGAL